MNILSKYTELPIPTWALSYLVNGDASGIDDKEQKQADNYMDQFYREAKEKHGHVIFSCGDGEGSFTHYPEFGLACDCIDCTVLIVN